MKGKDKYFEKREETLRRKGFYFICGADEVGRGSWAGPIVATAMINKKSKIKYKKLQIRDSKKLTERKREEIFNCLIDDSDIIYNVAWVSSKQIDKIGLGKANQLVLKKAVEGLKTKPDYILVDGFMIKDLKISQERIVKGDEKILSIAVASIIAKVSRDRYMKKLAKKYPQYGFEKHKGYGTKQHLKAIKRFGICSEHRRGFKPIKQFLNF